MASPKHLVVLIQLTCTSLADFESIRDIIMYVCEHNTQMGAHNRRKYYPVGDRLRVQEVILSDLREKMQNFF